jgi:hypothetical protein
LRNAQKALLGEVLAAEGDLIDFIGGSPGQWRGDQYLLPSDALVRRERSLSEDLNAAVRTLVTFERNNGMGQ